MSSPLPGNTNAAGAPNPPIRPEEWPTQPGEAVRSLASFWQIVKQAYVMPWKQASVLLVWAVIVPSAATFLTNELMSGASEAMTSATELGSQAIGVMLGLGLLAMLGWTLYICVSLATSAFVPAFVAESVRSRLLGYRSTAREIWTVIRRTVWRILGYMVLLGLTVGVALTIVIFVIAFIFGILIAIATPGPATPIAVFLLVAAMLAVAVVTIWVSIRLAFVPSAIIFEGAKIKLAMSRSWELTKGRVWRIFGTLLVATAGFVVVVLAIMFVTVGMATDGYTDFSSKALDSLPSENFSLLSVLLDLVMTPLSALSVVASTIATTLLYLDARTKSELLDATLDSWQHSVNQGLAAQQLAYPFATPVAAQPSPIYAPPAPPATGWQQS